MWGYQIHFRAMFGLYAERVFKRANVRLKPTVLLLGVRHPDAVNELPVCIEPEDGWIKDTMFEGIEAQIEGIIATHPNRNTLYGDDVRMVEKPARIRADSVRRAVVERLQAQDKERGIVSLVGFPVGVEKYDVLPVLQFDAGGWGALTHLQKTTAMGHYRLERSLPEALVSEILKDVYEQLGKPDAGRFFGTFERDELDVLRAAGRALTYVAAFAGGDIEGLHGVFDSCNYISSLRYEGAAGIGSLVIARRGHPDVGVILELKTPVDLQEAGWARKVLQVASGELSLLADTTRIYGFGQLRPNYDARQEDAFVVVFSSHYKWELRHSGDVLFRCEYGVPSLPQPRFDAEAFKKDAGRLLPGLSRLQTDELWRIVSVAMEQKHGTMLVVSRDASSEANRLGKQATPIVPTKLSDDVIRRITRIDGAVLVDPSGVCHAIGVILDGKASPNATPARGARYNSAVRYVEFSESPVLAVVISEDGQVDLLPKLRPQIDRRKLQQIIESGRHSVVNRDWKSLNRVVVWLDEHRFYLRSDDCDAANKFLKMLNEEPQEANEIRVIYSVFTPSELMNDLYFLPAE